VKLAVFEQKADGKVALKTVSAKGEACCDVSKAKAAKAVVQAKPEQPQAAAK
jgi:hypothetical protein